MSCHANMDQPGPGSQLCITLLWWSVSLIWKTIRQKFRINYKLQLRKWENKLVEIGPTITRINFLRSKSAITWVSPMQFLSKIEIWIRNWKPELMIINNYFTIIFWPGMIQQFCHEITHIKVLIKALMQKDWRYKWVQINFSNNWTILTISITATWFTL